jgi:hypothetical protein
MKKKSVQSTNSCISVIQTKYGIIKAHGGDLRVGSKEGEVSIFIIQIPIS